MRGVVLVALAAVVGPSWATNTNKPMTMSQIAARQVEAKYGAADAIWRDVGTSRTVNAAVSPAGSVVLSSVVKGPSPLAGAVIDVAVVRTVPWSAVSRAFAKSLPLVGTALAIKDIADAIRCREAAGGSSECDPGQNEVEAAGFRCQVPGGSYTAGSFGTRQQACESTLPLYAAGTTGSQYCPSLPGYSTISFGANLVRPQSGHPTRYEVYRNKSVSPSCSTITSGPVVVASVDTITGVPVLSCPLVVINGVTVQVVKGADGKCPTMIYTPASENDVSTKAETWGDKSKAPLIVGDLNAAGKAIEHPFPTIDPVPDSVVGPRETTSNPDGSTTIRDTSWDLAPTPTGYEWTPRVVTKDYPPGATIPPPGTVTDGTTTTGSAPKDEQITCGLPNTPPCKIDETGTPTTGDISKAEVDAAKGSALGKITEIGAIQAPAWTWSFSLPSSCQPMTVGPFLTQTVTVDLCQYQPMIHDLVALIWASFTVWACVGMVGRTFATG